MNKKKMLGSLGERMGFMDISVCIGSSCHLRGSYDIIKGLEALIEQHGLQNQINLAAAFCLGNCTNGVTIKVNDRIVTGVSTENLPQVFKEHVLKALS